MQFRDCAWARAARSLTALAPDRLQKANAGRGVTARRKAVLFLRGPEEYRSQTTQAHRRRAPAEKGKRRSGAHPPRPRPILQTAIIAAYRPAPCSSNRNYCKVPVRTPYSSNRRRFSVPACTASNSATMDTAICCGVSASMVSPMGQHTAASSASGTPCERRMA